MNEEMRNTRALQHLDLFERPYGVPLPPEAYEPIMCRTAARAEKDVNLDWDVESLAEGAD